MAAHLNSEIMIMDEVLAVGDMAFQNKCLTRMQRAADEEGKTVLYVNHNMATIRQLCDRCIVMDQGRIVYDGGVEDAIAMYMNLGLEDNAVDIDLTGRSKLKEALRTKMKLHHVTLIDKVLPTYEQGEDMLLRLRFSVLQPVDNVTFRTTIVNDTNTPLGTRIIIFYDPSSEDIEEDQGNEPFSSLLSQPVTHAPLFLWKISIIRVMMY